MDAIDFVEQLESIEAEENARKWVTDNHGKEALSKIMSISEAKFKAKFRMSKITFTSLVKEVIFDKVSIT